MLGGASRGTLRDAPALGSTPRRCALPGKRKRTRHPTPVNGYQEVAGALRTHVTKLARTLALHQQRTPDPAGSRKMYLTAEDHRSGTLRDVKNSENPRFPREVELHQNDDELGQVAVFRRSVR